MRGHKGVWRGGFRNYREGTRDPQFARMEFFLYQPVEYTIAMLEALPAA